MKIRSAGATEVAMGQLSANQLAQTNEAHNDAVCTSHLLFILHVFWFMINPGCVHAPVLWLQYWLSSPVTKFVQKVPHKNALTFSSNCCILLYVFSCRSCSLISSNLLCVYHYSRMTVQWLKSQMSTDTPGPKQRYLTNILRPKRDIYGLN